ncbi:GNAT family N-acetyltransferase [Nocardia sp. XZ_19_385]|uniref:GNAT family N-acetyltransferase n=1 Tax=Nocardia sp. XZ_19_385 TaxID=2769488 RepID=UPI001E62E3B9|nr:GNAT family N-acetyltransferase [Nocardia sp. XZ_19_385]
MSLMSYWPLPGLRVRTPRLELRMPGMEDLGALAGLAAEGVHDPAVQPFTAAWTDVGPDERARGLLQWHWRCWADWQVAAWTLNFVVLRDGEVVGTQSISARDFAVCAEVNTGSWLGLKYHGQGMGTEMRAAVLELAFAWLGADSAVSGAFEDNFASHAVSRKLGYEKDGVEMHAVRGKPAVLRRLRLTRARWEAAPRVPVEVTGLAECLPLFGVPTKP